MIQFYFFSVLLNVSGGYALCPDAGASRGTPFDGVRAFVRDGTVRLVIGILAAVTGALKFLTVMHGDIPVVGDFLPALSGVAVGSTLLVDYIESGAAARRNAEEAEAGEGSRARSIARGKVGRYLLANKEAVGIAGIIAGIVHFLFPMVMFL